MQNPKQEAINKLMQLMNQMEADEIRPKKIEEPKEEVAEIDPEKAKQVQDGFLGKPKEKKKPKVAEVEVEEGNDEEERKLLEELYSKIG